jgi:hypothetical protein
MSQVANLYLISKNDLSPERFDEADREDTYYPGAGFTFIALHIYSKDVVSFDWDSLALADTGQSLSNKTGAWITVFSEAGKQEVLTRLDPANLSADKLEQFAIDLFGDEGIGQPMLDAAEFLHRQIGKITSDRVLVLDVC